METKFTKGEWMLSHRENHMGMYSTEVYDEKGEIVCTRAWHEVSTEKRFKTDRDANAKLIAAAPEMFDALNEIYEDREAFAHLFESQQDKVIAALKKATE